MSNDNDGDGAAAQADDDNQNQHNSELKPTVRMPQGLSPIKQRPVTVTAT